VLSGLLSQTAHLTARLQRRFHLDTDQYIASVSSLSVASSGAERHTSATNHGHDVATVLP
jgi:hypothetical protein